MEYRVLGSSGLKVSPICLGTMMFGGPADETASCEIMAHAADAGINFIDTADVYEDGRSEKIVGKFIAPNRQDWVLATKVGNKTGSGPNQKGLSRKYIMDALDASLKRLKTDYIDIYYFHLDDHSTPLEVSIAAVGDLIRSGKVRYWGMSNYLGWRMALAVSLCDQMGVPRPVVCQPYYNAMTRLPEIEVLPTCEYFGMGVVPYSPLARGVLTGKYKIGEEAPGDSRAGSKNARILETEFRRESLEMAVEIKAHAEKKGMTAGEFAVGWVLNNKIITSVLAGPRTVEQMQGYISALDHNFDEEDEALIDGMVVSGHPSTPGYSDPAYPYRGRGKPKTPIIY